LEKLVDFVKYDSQHEQPFYAAGICFYAQTLVQPYQCHCLRVFPVLSDMMEAGTYDEYLKILKHEDGTTYLERSAPW